MHTELSLVLLHFQILLAEAQKLFGKVFPMLMLEIQFLHLGANHRGVGTLVEDSG